MIERLKQWVCVSGSTLDWFSSYLSDRSFSVSLGPYMSETVALSCGVPQGLILGPILFALYMLPLGHVISKFITVTLTIFSSMSLLSLITPTNCLLHNYVYTWYIPGKSGKSCCVKHKGNCLNKSLLPC